MTARAALVQFDTREELFADQVTALASRPDGSRELLELCDERHPVYREQSPPAISRMRGWVLLALARSEPLPDAALPFVLEELESGGDSYLVSAAAFCLRSSAEPQAAFAGPLLQALFNSKGVGALVTLSDYGGLCSCGSASTSPLRELVETIRWMGPLAAPLAEELETTVQSRAAAPEVLRELERIVEGLREAPAACCAGLPDVWNLLRWKPADRSASAMVNCVSLEDHLGQRHPYREWFAGHPTIVVFFYTRCDNPQKCSLTVAKLGRAQKLLEEHGLAFAIHTAAITYDASYDTPERLYRYGKNRGMRIDEQHHMLRAPEGFDALRRYFELGVSFFDSLVSRHKIEVFVLDSDGRIAASFARLAWSEEKVVKEAAALLTPRAAKPTFNPLSPAAGLAALVIPKCPLCWATYMSYAGVTGVAAHPSTFALKASVTALLVIHLATVFWRIRATGWKPAHLVSVAGALAITLNVALGGDVAGLSYVGMGLVLLACVLHVFGARSPSEIEPSTRQAEGADIRDR